MAFGALTIVGVSIMVFVVMRILPGDPLVAIFGPEGMSKLTEEQRAHFMKDLGLSDPLWVQYFAWVKDILAGNFGRSFFRSESVADMILRRGPLTAEIALLSAEPLSATQLADLKAALKSSLGRDVALTKIADHGDAGGLSQCVWRVELNGVTAARLMADGLTVAANGADGVRLQALASQQLVDTFACQAGPAVFRQCRTCDLVRAAAAQGKQLLTQVVGHWQVMGGEQLRLLALFDQGNVQAIEAGAGHYPQVERHGLALVRCEQGGLFLIHAGDQWLALLHEA